MILTTKRATEGGDIHTAGIIRVSRIKGRLTACEGKSENHYDTGVSSQNSDLAASGMFFCIVLVKKLEIICFDVSKAYCQGILPVGDDQPSFFLRLPAMYPALGRPTCDEQGRSYLFEITGNLYSLIRVGETWWEYAKNWITNEMPFEQSAVNACLFHIYWDQEYYCPFMKTSYPGDQEGHIVLYVDNNMSAFSMSKGFDGLFDIKNWFKSNFDKQFGSSDAGADSELTCFIGLHSHRHNNAISVLCPNTRQRLHKSMLQHGVPVLSNAKTPLPELALELAYELVGDSNPIVEFPARHLIGSGSFLSMAVEPFAALPCCSSRSLWHQKRRQRTWRTSSNG